MEEQKKPEQLYHGGVLYRPGITLAHLKRNEQEAELCIKLRELAVLMNENLPPELRLSARKIDKKVFKIQQEIIDKYFTDEITEFNRQRDREVAEEAYVIKDTSSANPEKEDTLK